MIRTLAILLSITAASSAAEPTPDVEMLVAAGEKPSVLALVVEVDGKRHADRWSADVDAVFADADANADGAIDERESARVLSALRVRQLGWGYLWAVPEAAPWAELDTAPKDGKATRDELAAYYRRHLVDAPQIGVGAAPPPAALTDALLKHLDADHDGTLADAEWTAADTALRPLDRNDDELIRPDELVARTLYPGSTGGVMLAPSAKGTVPPKLLADLPVARLTTRRETPDRVTLTLRLGDRTPAASDAAFAPGEPQSLRVVAYTVASPVPADFAAARKAATERFAAADADRSGQLDRTEAAGYAPLRDHFDFADRNADATLTAAEWDAYLAVRSHLVAAQASITVLDHGRGLFEAVDTDADGALSVRELRTAAARLTALGAVRDGRLDAAKLPHTVRLVASRGRPQSLHRSPPRSGPAWFLAADRNRDGDVSRREFVGTEAEFRRFDANRDDLITPLEAMARSR